MRLDDWILALHLLSAFALVGALTLFSILIVALWRTDDPARVVAFMRLSRAGTIAVGIGTAGTIVFGVWLAISIDVYEVWDGWIIAAIVLWAIAVELGRRAGAGYTSASERAAELATAGTASSEEMREAFGSSRAFQFHAASVVVTLLVLVDMIWKPGA